ncbi:MAG: polyphosphate polymerase domain-containing protein [Clostridia bacterium]|nr:polyphosphate polymerase domain-containing protein [Clostridia bacterium]
MEDICIFKRTEKKYLLTEAQYLALMQKIGGALTPDAHGKSTVCNLYLDTPSFLLIRRSIDAKNESAVYKEKLRLRSYGIPDAKSRVFLEIKKKFKSVVYKRRVSMSLREAMAYLKNGTKPFDSQIMREIDYAMHLYCHPVPAVYLSYDREAFYSEENPALRLTFDTNIRYRTDHIRLEDGIYGKKILADHLHLLEIKSDGAMPLWLTKALDETKIFPTSFSKYATAYLDMQKAVPVEHQEEKEILYV